MQYTTTIVQALLTAKGLHTYAVPLPSHHTDTTDGYYQLCETLTAAVLVEDTLAYLRLGPPRALHRKVAYWLIQDAY